MTGQGLSTTVVATTDRFCELTEEWDRLVAGCRTATPFQTHAWLDSWARAYCSPDSLRVVLVRSGGGELVAAAPLYLDRRFLVRTLRPLGVDVSDFCDVLVADTLGDQRSQALGALAGALVRLDGWDVVDLPEVRPSAAVLDLVAVWPGSSVRAASSTCLELPVEDLTDLLARLPRSTARHIRGKLRKIDDSGTTCREVPAARTREALDRFFHLRLLQWEGRTITTEHTRPRFRTFLHSAIPAMVERGQAVVVEYEANGEVLAVGLDVVGQWMMGAYLSGISPALRDRIDVATLTRRTNMALARARELTVLSLLRGQEEYKMRWRPAIVVNSRLVLGRPGSLVADGQLAMARARGRALPWLRANAPWLRSVKNHARQLVRR